MRRTFPLHFQHQRWLRQSGKVALDLSRAPIVQIKSGTFYQQHPNALVQDENPPLFPNLTFDLPSQPIEHSSISSDGDGEQQHWAVIGTNSKTTLLEILRGSHIAIPPGARTYPYLSSDTISKKDPSLRIPSRAIQYVGFAGDRGQSSGGVRGAYLSARYESHREETDWSVKQYLKGETELNPSDSRLKTVRWDEELLNQVIKDLRLEKLIDMPVGNLSNGQTRRARIAKALLGKPEVLLLDEPFMGLDPPTLTTLSPILRDLAYKSSPRLVLSLRPQDPIPDWITHVVLLGENNTVAIQGPTAEVLSKLTLWANGEDVPTANGKTLSAEEMTTRYGTALTEVGHILKERQSQPADSAALSISQDQSPQDAGLDSTTTAEPLIELKSVVVKYGPKVVLGGGSPNGLDLTISRGSRLLILGPNGSGKTTLLSLLTSDHPQSYSLPVFHFGRGRLPTPGVPGISLFDIQSRMGHSSPEIHAFFPRTMSIRATLESAWADTFIAKPELTDSAPEDINAVLRWFEPELNPHHTTDTSTSDVSWAASKATHTFATLPFQSQRLLLVLRAIIKRPDIIILDEAFSGLSPYVREKTIAFLETGFTTTVHPAPKGKGWIREPAQSSAGQEPRYTGISDRQALVVVSHVREEVPGCVSEWVRLPGEDELEHADSTVGIKKGNEKEGHGSVAASEERWRTIWGL